MSQPTGQVVIIGGGISGLSAAYDLSRAGIPHILLEKENRLGGVFLTRRLDGCILEAGPDSFLAAKPEALQLVKELGLQNEVIGSNDHQRTTYILKKGKLVPLPDGIMMIVPTKWVPMVKSPLLSWGTKLGMGFELLRRPSDRGDRSVAEFVTDHFGQETLDYLAEPLLSGVYGGDPKRMSMAGVLPRFLKMEADNGSLARTVMKSKAPPSKGPLFSTLKNGIGTLTDKLAQFANVRHAMAEAIERTPTGLRVRAGGEWLDARAVIVAAPAWAVAPLVSGLDAELAKLLSEIEYSSSITLGLVYDAAKFDGKRAGFGFLVPRKEGKRMAAATFVATKFPNRAPDDRIVIRCFFGGALDESIMTESDESILAIAQRELKEILGLTTVPLDHAITRWNRSMAQYTVGCTKRTPLIKERAAAIPGLYLAGNAYDGIGIPDCIRSGRAAAAQIAKR